MAMQRCDTNGNADGALAVGVVVVIVGVGVEGAAVVAVVVAWLKIASHITSASSSGKSRIISSRTHFRMSVVRNE
jgi:hypothetical protein